MNILDYKIFSNQHRFADRSPVRISLLIGFYNNLRCFELQMASLEMQTMTDFEVLLCDDGSSDEVVQQIRAYMKDSKFIIKHLWQKDDGWRKCELLNKGLLACESEYVVFVDQDCLLHPEFLKEHYINRSENLVLAGRRAELTEGLSQKLTVERIHDQYIQKNYWWFLLFMFFHKDNQWFKGLYLKSAGLRRFFNRKKKAIVGCNFSVHIKHLKAINGVDMTYQRPCGAEDTDVGIRLNNLGLQTKSICNMAVQYHLWHRLRTEPIQIPSEYLEGAKTGTTSTKNGLGLIPKVEVQFV
jgi:glycosyltransferase involved in cell wall biosynthesis